MKLDQQIFSLNLMVRDKENVWKLEGELLRKTIDPQGICSDSSGRLFIADGKNQRILVLDGSTGLGLQALELSELGTILDVIWCDRKSQLIVHHKRSNEIRQITYFNFL